MDRGAWWATAQNCKESDATEQLNTVIFKITDSKPVLEYKIKIKEIHHQ